ncbi:Protein COBRA [Euphorbia peplus]|nr:Protein COBRA [Euphorbia peplus]
MMHFVISSFLLIITIILVSCCTLSECYDTLDPGGEITVTFDIIKWTDDGYQAKVSIENKYEYRQIGKPGWKIGWGWKNKEVIWSMAGAFATSQGDCTNFPYKTAHCCQQNPEISDWDTDAPAEVRSDDCCRGGVLSAKAIRPENSFSSFEITVGNLNINQSDVPVAPPANLTLLGPGPGYTCSPIMLTEPTESSDIGGKRKVQVFRTWKSRCTYSSFVANKKPVCCVSLSSFYNPKVTKCPDCSCGCRESLNNTLPCISDDTSLWSDADGVDLVKCSDHMCPVGVHWHIKNMYTSYWRVKLTISNYNYKRNYSDWNVLVQHPTFTQKITSYSFNKTILPTVGFTDKVAIFWGIENFNAELMEAKEQAIGSVSTEILIEKDLSSFTLSNGWGFPRRIYFSGEECQMPLPDSFPMLPNACSPLFSISLFLFLPYLTSILLFTLL